mmetsp:Transcript_34283/g.74183  ORF Transcript_34283/g.74183 Transcript_34283/m.74183 type:complete len:388 (-) Transcript_34283:789-1952(-)
MRGTVSDPPIFPFTRSSNDSSLVEMIPDSLNSDSLKCFFCRSSYPRTVSSPEGNNLSEDSSIFLLRRSSTASLARILPSTLSRSLADPFALLGAGADPPISLLMRSSYDPFSGISCDSIGGSESMRGTVSDPPIFPFTRSSNDSSLVKMMQDSLGTDSLIFLFSKLAALPVEGNKLPGDWLIFLFRRSSTASLARILLSSLSRSLEELFVALLLGAASNPFISLLMNSSYDPTSFVFCDWTGGVVFMGGTITASLIVSITRSSNESGLVKMMLDSFGTDSLIFLFSKLAALPVEGNKLPGDWLIFLFRRSSTASLARILLSSLSRSLEELFVALLLGTAANPFIFLSLSMSFSHDPTSFIFCDSSGGDDSLIFFIIRRSNVSFTVCF